MSLSVVIATYNRAALVPRSIRSALDALDGITSHEVVVVDDASSDDTVERLQEVFAGEISSGRVKVLRNAVNRGVTGSKNEGYSVAWCDWVIFLDSDDTILPGVGEAVVSALEENDDKPLVFFRCVDQDGNFVGTSFGKDIPLDLDAYLEHTSYGEALTAVNKRIVRQVPYVESLRGYEGLGCCRIIAQYGPVTLSTVVARRYDCSSDDRLSVSDGLFRRMPLIAQGHLMLVREFGSRMRWSKALGYLLKAAAYGLIGGAYRLVKGDSK